MFRSKSVRVVSLCFTARLTSQAIPHQIRPVNLQMIQTSNKGYSTIRNNELTISELDVNSNCNNYLLLMGLFGFLWNNDEEKDETKLLLLPIKKLIFKANGAILNLKYNLAEEYLHDALNILDNSEQSTTQPFIEARAVILDKLGNMYLECGEWQKAVSVLTMVISLLRISKVEEESSSIIELSLKVAKACANMKQFDKARIGFEWCVTKAQALLNKTNDDENTALLGICSHSKAQFHMMVKEPKMAYKNYEVAIECAMSVFGKEHSQLAIVINDSATALDAIDDCERAMEVINKAITIIEADKDAENYHENMTVFLMNLAAVHRNKEYTVKAIETYELSLQHAYRIPDRTLVTEIKQLIKILKKKEH